MHPLKVLGLFLGIAAVPVMSLAKTAARNPWTAPVSLAKASLMVVIVGGTFFALAYLAGLRWSKHRTASTSVVGWFALLFLNIGGLRDTFISAGLTASWHWVIVVLALAALAVWVGTSFDPAARYLVTFIPTLVVLQAVLLIGDLAQVDEPAPIASTASEADIGAPPSIWVIVLDSHASPKVLRDEHDIDLAEPISRLETIGFRVWDDARSNYSHTLVAIPSLLSGEIWGPEVVEASYPSLLAGVHGDTPLVASIQRAGFTIRMIPANWSRSKCGAIVDECVGNPLYDEHWQFLVRSTPLSDLFPGVVEHPWPSRGRRSLEAIATIPGVDHHFTFVHSLGSHPPTVMNEDCNPVSDRDGRLSNQLPCTHDALLAALTTIDLTTDVVIVTADHGYSIGNALAPPDEWRDEVARDKFSAFTAISTPDGCAEGLPVDLSTGQILPLVLNCYGGDLPIPSHRFLKVIGQPHGGVRATELAWDGWSTYAP